MSIIFRNTKLSFTKHWGAEESASIIRHFRAAGHSVPDLVREVIGMGIACRNPTLAKCGGEAQHFQSWGFGVLRDSRMFRARQQGPKHLALRCSWFHWKGLEA
jgi:hypothetical protein